MAGRSQRFTARLAGIAAVAFAWRVAFTLVARRSVAVAGTHRRITFPLKGDDLYYHVQGKLLAHGHGFIDPVAYLYARANRPTAAHPPLYGSFLGVVTFLGGTTPLWQRLAGCALGAATVVTVGLLARRLGGDRAGLVAAAAAALYPNLWINDVSLLSETLYSLLVAVAVVAAYRWTESPTLRRAAWLGCAIALAALTRAEAAALLVLLVVPLVMRNRALERRAAAKHAAVAIASGALVLAPWMVSNLVRFDHPELMSTGIGQVTAIGSCDETFHGTYLGYWAKSCAIGERIVAGRKVPWPPGCNLEEIKRREKGDRSIPNCDESDVDVAARKLGFDYLKGHKRRVPLVVAARVGRAFDVYAPFQGIHLNTFFESRGLWPSRLALASYYLMLPFAAIGLAAMWRRRQTVVPFVSIAVVVAFTAAVSFGITRYRVPLDVVVPVLAALGLERLLSRGSAAPAAGAAGDGAEQVAVSA